MNKFELNYTSNPEKFLSCCQQQILSYQNKTGNTIIQTHISPTSLCNFDCEYCSVKNREVNVLDIEIIKDYIEKLIPRGLKSVIITGGGEPLAYSRINNLLEWLGEKDLAIGLITNGTLSNRLANHLWKYFTWVRISVNLDCGKLIDIPVRYLNKNSTVGLSVIVKDEFKHKEVSNIADRVNATYIRVLPDCRISNENIENEQKMLELFCEKINIIDKRYFFQHKFVKTPSSPVCYQAYFRPYLHEDGYVYPCDSVVLNNEKYRFIRKYRICEAKDILWFLNRGNGNTIAMKFSPGEDCPGCVFHDTVDILNDHLGKQNKRKLHERKFVHEQFI
jgi:organic radical activating enzyme